MKPTIWIPKSFNEGTPRFICRLCQEPQYTAQALARHVKSHVKKDPDKIAFMSARERHPELFGDDGVDLEYEKWCRDRGFNARPQ